VCVDLSKMLTTFFVENSRGVADCIVANTEGHLSVSDMNAVYKRWCDDNGYKKVSAKRLEDALTAEFAPDDKKGVKRISAGKTIKAHIGGEFNSYTDIDTDGVAL